MDQDEGWLMRPIKFGMLPYLALDDVTYDLEDFLLCCESLDVDNENEMRARLKGHR